MAEAQKENQQAGNAGKHKQGIKRAAYPKAQAFGQQGEFFVNKRVKISDSGIQPVNQTVAKIA